MLRFKISDLKKTDIAYGLIIPLVVGIVIILFPAVLTAVTGPIFSRIRLGNRGTGVTLRLSHISS